MNLNRSSSHSHSVCRLFTVVLLGLFLIFLLVMLLFSAQAYRTATKGTQQNNNLYTASSYISVKFHQHDSSPVSYTHLDVYKRQSQKIFLLQPAP